MSEWKIPGKYCVSPEDGKETVELAHGYYQIGNHLYWKNELIQDAKDSRHYNDLLYSSCYTPYYRHFDCNTIDPCVKLEIGSAVKCLRCEEGIITTKDTMMCEDCEIKYGNSNSEDYSYCSCCGQRGLTDHMLWIGDDLVCSECYEEQSFTCACCGERYYNSEKRYDTQLNNFVCYDCFNRTEED